MTNIAKLSPERRELSDQGTFGAKKEIATFFQKIDYPTRMGYINHTSSLSSALRTQFRLHLCSGVAGFIIILRVRTWKLITKELLTSCLSRKGQGQKQRGLSAPLRM
jgi:hypothetical protein